MGVPPVVIPVLVTGTKVSTKPRMLPGTTPKRANDQRPRQPSAILPLPPIATQKPPSYAAGASASASRASNRRRLVEAASVRLASSRAEAVAKGLMGGVIEL